MINLELNKLNKRKKLRKLDKLPLMPNPKLKLMPLKRELDKLEPRLRLIVSSMRHSSKPNTSSFNKELPKRELPLLPSKLLLRPFREESKLKNLLLP